MHQQQGLAWTETCRCLFVSTDEMTACVHMRAHQQSSDKDGIVWGGGRGHGRREAPAEACSSSAALCKSRTGQAKAEAAGGVVRQQQGPASEDLQVRRGGW